MSNPWLNVVLIAVFIAIGGVFAAAEMALVSLRESQVKKLRTRGARGKKVASLAANPNRFLSAIQICITFSGFLSASFGAATLADEIAPFIMRVGVPDGVANVLALVGMTIVISYFSIVFGELAAKRLAMQHAETYAMALSGMIDVVATLARPLIWFLGVSTNIVVRLLGGDPQAAREEVTDDELRAMVSESPSLGKEGRHIVDEVFAAGDRSLREVMVPRTEVEFLTADTTAAEAIARVERAPHSRYPITGSSVDDIEGFLHVRDLMNLSDEQRQAPIRELARPIVFLPGTVKVMHALTEMRRMSVHLAIVHDEYAGTAGIITMEDLVEELIGEIQDEYDPVAQPVVKAGDSLDMDGLMTLEQFSDLTGYVLPEGPYDTVAGFWVACHGQLPQKGDVITATLHRVGEADGPEASAVMTITEMDGRRAARIAVVIQPVEPTVESIKSSAKGSAKSSGKEKLSSKDRPSVKEKSA